MTKSMNLKYGMVWQTYILVFHTGRMRRYAWEKPDSLNSSLQKHCTQKARTQNPSTILLNFYPRIIFHFFVGGNSNFLDVLHCFKDRYWAASLDRISCIGRVD